MKLVNTTDLKSVAYGLGVQVPSTPPVPDGWVLICMADPHEIDIVYKAYFDYWYNHPKSKTKIIKCFVDGEDKKPSAFHRDSFREVGFMATAEGDCIFVNLLACLYAANMGRFFYFYRGKVKNGINYDGNPSNK